MRMRHHRRPNGTQRPLAGWRRHFSRPVNVDLSGSSSTARGEGRGELYVVPCDDIVLAEAVRCKRSGFPIMRTRSERERERSWIVVVRTVLPAVIQDNSLASGM